MEILPRRCERQVPTYDSHSARGYLQTRLHRKPRAGPELLPRSSLAESWNPPVDIGIETSLDLCLAHRCYSNTGRKNSLVFNNLVCYLRIRRVDAAMRAQPSRIP